MKSQSYNVSARSRLKAASSTCLIEPTCTLFLIKCWATFHNYLVHTYLVLAMVKKRPASRAFRVHRRPGANIGDAVHLETSAVAETDQNENPEHTPMESGVEPVHEPKPKRKSRKKATDETATDHQQEQQTETGAASSTNGAGIAGNRTKQRKSRNKETAAKTKPKAKAKRKGKPVVEENPWDLPPDDDQQKVSQFFKSFNPDKDTSDPETPKKDVPPSSSSSSSSPTTTAVDVTGRLGAFEEEEEVLPGSPVMIQPDQTRSRIQMFSFPYRHVQRLRKHSGEKAVTNLANLLGSATLVSLYSGLGGAEIASTLVANAVQRVQSTATTPVEPPEPEYLLACDHSNDCQKILQSHRVPCPFAFPHELTYMKKSLMLMYQLI